MTTDPVGSFELHVASVFTLSGITQRQAAARFPLSRRVNRHLRRHFFGFVAERFAPSVSAIRSKFSQETRD